MNDVRMIQPALLRPAFTRALADRLRDGASLNLTAPHGLGRRRTLQDLRRLLPAGMRVLFADMKLCAADCQAMLHELHAQTGMAGAAPQDLGLLIDILAASGEPALLILHNVDLLRFSPHDPLFDTALLSHLDRIATYPNIALLTVSEAVYADWPLPCEQLPLPPLDTDEQSAAATYRN